MFRATLFRIVKTWMQDKCPSTDERVTDRQTGIPPHHKKERNNAICSNMDGPRGYHTKWSKSDRVSYDIAYQYMWDLKYDTNELN